MAECDEESPWTDSAVGSDTTPAVSPAAPAAQQAPAVATKSRDRSGMTIPLRGSASDVGRGRDGQGAGRSRRAAAAKTAGSAGLLRQQSVGQDWPEAAARAEWSGSADSAYQSVGRAARCGHRSPRLSPSLAREACGHSRSTCSVGALGGSRSSRGLSHSAGHLGRSPSASPYGSCSCSHSAELAPAAARRRPRDPGAEQARRHRPRGAAGGRPPRRRLQLERQALSLDGKPRSSQAQRRRQATLLRQTTVEVPDCAYLPRLDLESAALGRSGPRSSGALSQRSSGPLRQSTLDASEAAARVSSASLSGRSPRPGSAVSGSASLVDLTAAGSELVTPMLPVLAMAVRKRAAAARVDKKRASRRMRWVVITTGLTLLVISVCLIGVTLRMAPMIDDMVRRENDEIYRGLGIVLNVSSTTDFSEPATSPPADG